MRSCDYILRLDGKTKSVSGSRNGKVEAPEIEEVSLDRGSAKYSTTVR